MAELSGATGGPWVGRRASRSGPGGLAAAGRLLSRLRSMVPRGLALPEHAWRQRHAGMIAGVGVLAGVAVALGWVTQGLVQALPAGALVAMLAVLAAASPPYRRELSSCIATIGLLTGTAVIVHLTGGVVQAHVLFLIVVAAVTLYQTWAPFWTAVVFATVHYGVLASLDPAALNPGAATADPWLRAGVHGALIGLAALVGIVAWRSEEVLRTGYARLAERNDAVLACVVDGILAIDARGRIRAANPAAHELLGCQPVGRDLGDVLAGHEDRRGGRGGGRPAGGVRRGVRGRGG